LTVIWYDSCFCRAVLSLALDACRDLFSDCNDSLL
jgi:hypothetical protein